MESVEQFVERCRKAAQLAAPDQQVSAVGILGRVNRRLKSTVGFPSNVMMAVTPKRLMAFEYRSRQDRITILRMVADWPRSVVEVEREPVADATVLRFQLIDGRRVELREPDQRRLIEKGNQPFYEALGLADTA